jgi:hypothetical protein
VSHFCDVKLALLISVLNSILFVLLALKHSFTTSTYILYVTYIELENPTAESVSKNFIQSWMNPESKCFHLTYLPEGWKVIFLCIYKLFKNNEHGSVRSLGSSSLEDYTEVIQAFQVFLSSTGSISCCMLRCTLFRMSSINICCC